jgi:hypothetical protein
MDLGAGQYAGNFSGGDELDGNLERAASPHCAGTLPRRAGSWSRNSNRPRWKSIRLIHLFREGLGIFTLSSDSLMLTSVEN